jgi:hypothetical protein
MCGSESIEDINKSSGSVEFRIDWVVLGGKSGRGRGDTSVGNWIAFGTTI